jgi:hypothetical protein
VKCISDGPTSGTSRPELVISLYAFKILAENLRFS